MAATPARAVGECQGRRAGHPGGSGDRGRVAGARAWEAGCGLPPDLRGPAQVPRICFWRAREGAQ